MSRGVLRTLSAEPTEYVELATQHIRFLFAHYLENNEYQDSQPQAAGKQIGDKTPARSGEHQCGKDRIH